MRALATTAKPETDPPSASTLKPPDSPRPYTPTALARSGCPHSGPAANVLGPEHVSGQWGESSMWRLAFGHETYRMRRDVGRSTMQ